MEQTELLYRCFAVMVFLSIWLNIVHMSRLSRRREYTILTTLGLSGRQKLGMQLYESFCFTLRTTALATLLLLVLVTVFTNPRRGSIWMKNSSV